MDMKWTPIIDGDLRGIPRDEELLFTVFDERDGETYVTTAWVSEYEGEVEVREATSAGLEIHEAKNVKAWMEFPQPFTPNGCNNCAEWEEWTDAFGDRWSKCELWNEPFRMDDCPLR